jgi:hypothetical protein
MGVDEYGACVNPRRFFVGDGALLAARGLCGGEQGEERG